MDKGFVDSKIQFVDATHVKAHANRHKNKREEIKIQAKAYQEDLEKEIDEDRKEHGKNPLKEKSKSQETRKITTSTTDPESGLFHKGEHKEVFAYNVQTSCDKNGWVLAYKIFPGNLHDSTSFIPFYEEKLKQYHAEKIVMDAGYKTPAIAKNSLMIPRYPYYPTPPQKEKPKQKSPITKKIMSMMHTMIATYAQKIKS